MQGGSITRWTWEQQHEGTGGGGGSVLLAGSTGQFRGRKGAQGQVHKYATSGVYFIIEDYSQKLSKGNEC